MYIKPSALDTYGVAYNLYTSTSYHQINFESSNVVRSNFNDGGSHYLNHVTKLQDLDWHYYCATFNGSIGTTYFDGNKQGTTPSSMSITGVMDNRIGGQRGGFSYFNGSIDEVKIWKRVLTPEEIKASFIISSEQHYANSPIGWNSIKNYPSYCSDGSFVLGTNDTLSCSTASSNATFNNVQVNNNLNVTGNITLGEKITFAFGEIIDNLVDGWLRITGNLNVTGNISVSSGERFCMDSTTCSYYLTYNGTCIIAQGSGNSGLCI